MTEKAKLETRKWKLETCKWKGESKIQNAELS